MLIPSSLHLLAQSFRTAEEKLPELVKFLGQHKGASIVYVQTHEVRFGRLYSLSRSSSRLQQTELISTALVDRGFKAYAYHAGMSSDLRTSVQDKFMVGDDIIVRVMQYLWIVAVQIVSYMYRSSLQ